MLQMYFLRREAISKSGFLVLFSLIILLLLARLIPLVFPSNIVFNPFDHERLALGTIAKEIIQGPRFPLYLYQIVPYMGGTLVSGIMAVPFFLLFGDSLFSLQLLGLLYTLVMLAVLYLFLDRYFNRKIAVIASLLFIFSPPLFFRPSLISYGTHYEIIVFEIIAVYLFFKIHFDNKKHFFNLALLGLVSGFAMYFCYTFLIILITYLFFWFISDRKFFLKKEFGIFLIFFLIGFSPWLYYNLNTDFMGIAVLTEIPPYKHFSVIDNIRWHISRVENIETYDIFIPQSRMYTFGIPTRYLMIVTKYLSHFYLLGVFVSFITVLWLQRGAILKISLSFIRPPYRALRAQDVPKELFFLMYPVIFSLIYAMLDIRLNWHYLEPVFFFNFITIALFLNYVLNSKIKFLRFISLVLLVVFLSCGIISVKTSTNLANFGRCFKEKGFNYCRLGLSLSRNLLRRIISAGKIDTFLPLIDKLELSNKIVFYDDLGIKVMKLGTSLVKALSIADSIEPAYKGYFYDGLGYGMALTNFFLTDKTAITDISDRRIEIYLNDITQVPEKYRDKFYYGFGRAIAMAQCNYAAKAWTDIFQKIPLAYQADYYIGIGEGMVRLIRASRFDEIKYSILSIAQAPYRPYCYEGIGRYVAKNAPDRIGFFLDNIEPVYRASCEKGFKYIHNPNLPR